MMLIFCSGKNRYERKKKKWKLRGSELKTQALPSTVTAASSYLLTAIRGIHHGFCKHMEQSADLKKKKKDGRERRNYFLIFSWFEALLYVHLIPMKKGVTGEVFTEAQQKNECCRKLRECCRVLVQWFAKWMGHWKCIFGLAGILKSQWYGNAVCSLPYKKEHCKYVDLFDHDSSRQMSQGTAVGKCQLFSFF